MRTKKDPNSYTELKKKLDKVFSVFIRRRDRFVCFTCRKVGDKKSIQCGHYISRTYTATRWDEVNCHAQCVSCNVFKSGNMAVYALNMTNKYGASVLAALDAKKRHEVKLSTIQLSILISKYESLAERLGDTSRN